MDIHKKGFSNLKKLLLATHDEAILDVIFDLLLTVEEKSDIAMRVLIVKELLSGKKTQREMAKDLNVSIAKITRGSNELKRLDKKTLEMLSALFRV